MTSKRKPTVQYGWGDMRSKRPDTWLIAEAIVERALRRDPLPTEAEMHVYNIGLLKAHIAHMNHIDRIRRAQRTIAHLRRLACRAALRTREAS